MTPHDFLDTASDLLDGPRESDWRSAVSRGSYAAFHEARRLLRDLGFDDSRAANTHAFVSQRLVGAGHPDVRAAGRRLLELRTARNLADYDLGARITHRRAGEHVLAAQEIVAVLEQVEAAPHVRDAVRDAVRAYERDVLREATWSG